MRVVIADDERHAREGLSAFLRTCPGIEVAGVAEDGQSAIGLAESVHPDVLLLDLQMAAMDGFEVTRQMKARMPDVRIVMLTMDRGQRQAALGAGADGFISKEIPPALLADALRDAYESTRENTRDHESSGSSQSARGRSDPAVNAQCPTMEGVSS